MEKLVGWSVQGKYGCKYAPMLTFTPLDHVVIDVLHLFLRIADVLTLSPAENRPFSVEKMKIFKNGWTEKAPQAPQPHLYPTISLYLL